ncbi:helix-turn-helix transcriptional regulator [Glycomyces scopariae]|uniref:DNA-binding transcriptional regulator, PadR family n=1 Tax=Glycomyces sambucus TaxID=380244 RepID=A0A1G9KRQ5_9ACTN|nr:helix-turn-helix transcriptional regulator [Glycomyces sambucus]SDL52530.1 DNA-binding transcriptional regulator, PadR family [Glycomyces sambucus]
MDADGIHGQLDTLILATLKRGEAHGYAIITALKELSGDRLDLPSGTVYPALRRLERAGSISGTWTVGEGRRRRVYALTEDGLKALEKGLGDWRSLREVMGAVLGT